MSVGCCSCSWSWSPSSSPAQPGRRVRPGKEDRDGSHLRARSRNAAAPPGAERQRRPARRLDRHDRGLLVTLFPFYWMLRTALSSNRSLAAGATDLLPVDFTLGGYRRVLGLPAPPGGAGRRAAPAAAVNFWLYLRNSIIVATVITAGQVFFSAMAAYAFARLRWPGRDAVFVLFLDRADGAADLHDAAELRPDQASRPAQHLPRHRAAAPAHDAVRGVLPAPVLPGHQPRGRRRRRASTARAMCGSSSGIDPADVSTAPITTLAILTYIDDLERLLLAAPGRPRTRASGCSPSPWASSDPRPRRAAPTGPGLMAATLFAALPMIILFTMLGRRVIDSIGYTGVK